MEHSSAPKEQTADSCVSMEKTQMPCVKWNKPDSRLHGVYTHIYDIFKKASVKNIEWTSGFWELKCRKYWLQRGTFEANGPVLYVDCDVVVWLYTFNNNHQIGTKKSEFYRILNKIILNA